MDLITQYNILKEQQENHKDIDTEKYKEKAEQKQINKIKKQSEDNAFVKRLSNLPNELISIIQSYVPKHTLAFLSRTLYLENHQYIRPLICRKQYEEYIRTTVRKDNDFVFGVLLSENLQRWLSIRNYYYHGAIYYNYIVFLKSYCSDFGSLKCKAALNKILEELGLSKNQHKKKTVRYIKWIL